MNMDMMAHIIPGYSYYSLYNTVNSDEPFQKKAVDAAISGASIGLHAIFAAHHGIRIQDAMIRTQGYYSGPTHGWGLYRAAYPAMATAAAVTAIVGAGAAVSYAIAGDDGLGDYGQFITQPKHIPFRTSWSIARIIDHYF